MSQEDEQFAYFIYIPVTKDLPECGKLLVEKATAKQVILCGGLSSISGYKRVWKREDIHFTALDAWLAYQKDEKKYIFDLGVDLDNTKTRLRAADLAIDALAQLSQALKPPGPPDPPPGYPKPRFG